MSDDGSVANENATKKFKAKTPLQALLTSMEWDALMVTIIILNCVWIATDNPRLGDSEQPLWQTYGQRVFSVIFILEFCLKVTAFGIIKYWMDAWNVLDTIVVLESFLSLLFLAIEAIAADIQGTPSFSGLSVIRFIRILRLVRLLRPLKAIRMVPAVRIYVEAIVKSLEAFFLNAIVLLSCCMACAFILNSVVNDALQYRCVPTNFSSVSVTNNSYYQTYGEEYFYSSYNSQYCNRGVMVDGSDDGTVYCDEGFSCENIITFQSNLTSVASFNGVGADFSTTINAFISSLSFLTFRGWPNIFFAIQDTMGLEISFMVLTIMFVTSLLVVNLFPAIFLNSLKAGNVDRRKLKWLSLYPGSKQTVSEFELMIWANANTELINKSKFAKSNGALTVFWNIIVYLFPFKSWIGRSTDNASAVANSKGKEGNDIDEADEEDNAQKILYRLRAVDERDPLEVMEEDSYNFFCVPRGRTFLRLRRIIFNEGSAFNVAMMSCIMLNIGFMAFNSELYPSSVQDVGHYSNIVFMAIYIAEAVFKLSVLGPFLYFDSPFNVFDLFLVLVSIPSLISDSSSSRFVSNLRIFRVLRLARLLRLARIYRVVKNVYTTRDKSVHNITLTPGKLFGMILNFFPPMLNVVFLNLLVMFVYACLGMSLFGSLTDLDLSNSVDSAVEALETASTTPSLSNVFYLWGARYTKRMNFHNFGNAFISVYNFGILNNWYSIMIYNIRASQISSFAFFFTLLLILYYVPQSTLLASVINIIEGDAKQALTSLAEDNEIVLRNVGFVSMRGQARQFLKKWHKNCLGEGGSSDIQGGEKRQVRPEITVIVDEAPQVDALTDFILLRQEYSLFLFPKDSWIRQWCRKISKSRGFSFILLCAIVVAVIPVATQDMSVDYFTQFEYYVFRIYQLVAFSFEMGLKWVMLGLFCSEGYFDIYSPMNYMDFANNILLIISFFDDTVRDIYTKTVVLRLFRVPFIMQNSFRFLGSNTEVLSIESSSFSVASVVLITSIAGFFFAIIGNQIYTTKFSYCSFDGYPASTGRYTESGQFPNGCNNWAYSTNSTTTDTIELHWKNALDSFDDIFGSARSILRIMTFNEWQGIIYSALDCVGQNVSPKAYNNRAAFLLFLVIGLISGTFLFVGVAVVYYHYFIETAKRNRRLIFGVDQAFWASYEERLRVIRRKQVVDKINIICQNNRLFKTIAIFYLLFPYILFLGLDLENSDSYYFCFAVCVSFNFAYAGLLLIRMISRRSFIPANAFDRVELVVAVVLVLFAVYQITTIRLDRHGEITALMKASSILRIFILSTFFTKLDSFFKILLGGLAAFIPQALFVLAVLFIFSTCAKNLFQSIDVEYNDSFLNYHYNFKTFRSSMITLMAMGTGNIWTEVIDAVKRDKGVGFGILVDGFFTAFFVFFASLFRSFPLLIIYRYLLAEGSACDVATQQVNQFQHAWELTIRRKKMQLLGLGPKYDAGGALDHPDDDDDDLFVDKSGELRASSKGEAPVGLLSKKGVILNAYAKMSSTMKAASDLLTGKISLDDLYGLVLELPPPLGMQGTNISFLDNSKFVRQILLSMPRTDSLPGSHDEPLFNEDSFPTDMSILKQAIQGAGDFELLRDNTISTMSNNDTYDSKVRDVLREIFDHVREGFTFKQCLIAVHKRVVLSRFKNIESKFSVGRVNANERLRSLRLRLSRYMVSKREPPRGIHCPGYFELLMLQKMDKELYRRLFVNIVQNLIQSIRVRSTAFEVSAFDMFLMSKVRSALKPEYAAAKLQLKLCKHLATPGCSNETLKNLVNTTEYTYTLKKLSKKMEELYAANADNKWDISSLVECASMGGKVGVTAIACDNVSTIYAAFANNDLKIYITGQPENFGRATYQLLQKLTLEEPARSLFVSGDGKQLLACVGSQIIVMASKAKKRAGRPQLAEVHRHTGHSSTTFFVLQYGPFFVSGGQDCYLMLWDYSKSDSLRYYYSGSALFCGCLCNVGAKLTTSGDDMLGLSNLVVSGTQNGQLIAHPLPSMKSSSADARLSSWVGINVSTGTCAVSSLSYAWNYLYVGTADGAVQAWTFIVLKPSEVRDAAQLQPIQRLSLIRLSNYSVHSGPVTSLRQAGGYLFSSSFDFSILPWFRPDKLGVSNSSQYSQQQGLGMVYHGAAVTCMATNRFCIVSGDQDGKIVATVPRVIQENVSLGSSSELFDVDVTKFVEFSFLAHDFGDCFVKHQKIVMKERVVLFVTNTYVEDVTLQVLPTKLCPQFDICFEHRINPPEVYSQVIRKVGDSFGKDVVSVKPMQTLAFELSFIPDEELYYNTFFEFLLNGKKIVKVTLRGCGIKPKIIISGNIKVFDFGAVAKGSQKVCQNFIATNPTTRDILVNCLDVTYPESVPPDAQISMATRNIEIIPKCFVVKAKSSTISLITFEPKDVYAPFELPLRFHYCGATYTEAKIYGRSEDQDHSKKSVGEVGRFNDSALTGNIGLRPLQPNESVITEGGQALLQALKDIGWRVLECPHQRPDEDGDPQALTCLYHHSSGAFLEFPPQKLALNEAGSQAQKMSTVHRLFIKFENRGKTMYRYQIRHGTRTISMEDDPQNQLFIAKIGSTGGADLELDGMNCIDIDVAQLFEPDPSEPKVPGNPEHIGAATIELDIWPSTSTDCVTVTTFFIKVLRGYRVQKRLDGDYDEIRFLDRLNILGIDQISSRVERKGEVLGEVHEYFTNSDDEKIDFGLPVLANATVAVHRKHADMAEFTIMDRVWSHNVPLNESDSARGLRANFHEKRPFLSLKDVEVVQLPRPQIVAEEGRKLETFAGCRQLRVKYAADLNDTAVSMEGTKQLDGIVRSSSTLAIPSSGPPPYDVAPAPNLAVSSASGSTANINRSLSSFLVGRAGKRDKGDEQMQHHNFSDYNFAVHLHSGPDIYDRSRRCHLSELKVLPRRVACAEYSIELSAEVGVDIEEPEQGGTAISSVTTDDEIEEDRILAEELEILIDQMMQSNWEKLFTTPGFDVNWYFVMEDHYLKLVSANPAHQEAALDSTDIYLRDFGFEVCGNPPMKTIYRDCYWGIDNMPLDPEESFNVISMNYGESMASRPAPALMHEVFDKIAMDEMRTTIKNYFKLLANQRLTSILTQTRARADAMIEQFEKALEADLRGRAIKRLTQKDLDGRKAVQDEAKAIMDEVVSSVTYKEVFEEMVLQTTRKQKDSSLFSSIGSLTTTAIAKETTESTKRVLNCFELMRYLETEREVIGANRALTRGQAIYVLQNIPRNTNQEVTLESFKNWYELDEGQKLSAQLNSETVFAAILNEHMGKRERYHYQDIQAISDSNDDVEAPADDAPTDDKQQKHFVSKMRRQSMALMRKFTTGAMKLRHGQSSEELGGDSALDEDTNTNTDQAEGLSARRPLSSRLAGLLTPRKRMQFGLGLFGTKQKESDPAFDDDPPDDDEDDEGEHERNDNDPDEDEESERRRGLRARNSTFEDGESKLLDDFADREDEFGVAAFHGVSAFAVNPKQYKKIPSTSKAIESTIGDEEENVNDGGDSSTAMSTRGSSIGSSQLRSSGLHGRKHPVAPPPPFHSSENASGIYRFFGKVPSCQQVESTGQSKQQYELGVLGRQRAEVADMYDSVF